MSNYCYKKIKKIGQGTFGSVYLTKHVSDGRIEVLKVIKKRNEQTIQLAYNEIRIFKLLQHPNIIQYYTCFSTEKHIYISMEYASNGNLYEYLFKQRTISYLQEKSVLNIFGQMTKGLDHIHSKHIVHRDLKPENILLTMYGKYWLIKISDYGISKILKNGLTNTIIGTPNYMAPEICAGKFYDETTDLWSLGCILYELCTLKRLFHDNMPTTRSTPIDKINKIKSELYSPCIPYLVRNLLSIQPEFRPSTNKLLRLEIIQSHLYHFTKLFQNY